tara:strand:- start:6628 stop:6810 length:183 start_codon:yes stop_codon:yes gene_type:complete
MDYLSVGVNPPPLDTKIIVKKSEFNFDDCAHIITMSSDNWSEESAAEFLIGSNLTLWAAV